ncbi:MAG: response regulator [Proteobacteria bacterium]|jgi:DNA-binding response OmpR family regulator/curved DNA-binding protein CbpA|nr:response regulator [Pseudomonadota bacterium]
MMNVSGQPGDKPVVLVVEDNDDVRRVVQLYLASAGFQVLEAGDGLAGLASFERDRPDLILLDVLLPKLDGLETLKRLRKSPGGHDVPVIMMSAVLQTRDLQAETAHLKVAAFLQKPFQVRRLLEEVRRVLNETTGVRSEVERGPTGAQTTTRGAADRENDEKILSTACRVGASGTLEEIPLPKILHGLFATNRTGRLRIVSGTTEKRIYFSSGLPVYAESSLPEETLGAYLIANRVITEAQGAEAYREMTENGRRFGEALLKLDLIGPHELFSAIERHLAEKVVSTISWKAGLFRFEDGEAWKDDVVIARMKPGRILIDGIRRYWSSESILAGERFTWDSVPFLADEAPYTDDQISLTSGEMKILQLVRRGLTMREIGGQIGDREQTAALLYALFVMERLGFSPRRAAQAPQSRVAAQRPAVEGVESPRPDASSKEEKAQALLAEYIKYRTADYFTLLGVPRDATAAQITAAFQTRQRRYHPDTLVGIDTGLVHEKMEELYDRVHSAFRTLTDAGLRAKYEEELDKGAKRTMLTQQSRTGRIETLANKPRHEILFEDGFSLLRNGEFSRALAMFEAAEKLEPKARYGAYRAWCSYLANPQIREKVERELVLLAKQNAGDGLTYYLLGNFYLREDNEKRATACYEKALSIDPQNIDATRQLRLIRMRQRQKRTEASGLFDLFKKK